jgi:putative transposase
MFVNFLHYKLDREGKVLVEIDRWFPSSKLCSNCHYQVREMPLDVRAWTCPSCGTHHVDTLRPKGTEILKKL